MRKKIFRGNKKFQIKFQKRKRRNEKKVTKKYNLIKTQAAPKLQIERGRKEKLLRSFALNINIYIFFFVVFLFYRVRWFTFNNIVFFLLI